MYATDTLTVGWMGVLAVIGGSLGALSFPATQAILASTVPHEDLESAVAINWLLAPGGALRRAGDRGGAAGQGGPT